MTVWIGSHHERPRCQTQRRAKARFVRSLQCFSLSRLEAIEQQLGRNLSLPHTALLAESVRFAKGAAFGGALRRLSRQERWRCTFTKIMTRQLASLKDALLAEWSTFAIQRSLLLATGSSLFPSKTTRRRISRPILYRCCFIESTTCS